MRGSNLAAVAVVVVLLCLTSSGCGLVRLNLPKIKIEPPAQEAQPEAATAPAETSPASADGTQEGATEQASASAADAADAADAAPEPTTEPPIVYGKLPRKTAPPAPRSPRYVPIGAQRTLTSSDLNGLSKWDLDVLRNEIYAAHGRTFNRSDLQRYFDRQTWYARDAGFSESRLSTLEKRNAAFIADYQKKRGQVSSSARPSRSSGSTRRTGSGGDMLSWSSSRAVTASDLAGMSDWQLDIARNEIYARHGRPFKRADLRNHFRSMSWYQERSNFSEGQLSSLEKRNAAYILSYQKSH